MSENQKKALELLEKHKMLSASFLQMKMKVTHGYAMELLQWLTDNPKAKKVELGNTFVIKWRFECG